MSYDENRMSDQIDGGNLERERLLMRIEKLEAEKLKLIELETIIESFKNNAEQSAKDFWKRDMNTSAMCSQAMAMAYNFCIKEIKKRLK